VGKGVVGGEWEGVERKVRQVEVRIESPLLWILDTPLLLHDHSDILLLLQSLTNCYHKTSINKPVKLHVLLSAVRNQTRRMATANKTCVSGKN